MKISNEFKTGVFVVVCLIAFGALILKVGNFSWTKKGYTLKSRFHFTGGIKKYAPVCLSGVDVGEVKDIRLIYGDGTTVELDLWIRDGVKIQKDSKALSSTFGLMGEKYVEIKAGTTASGYAAQGDVLEGADPFRMEELVDIGKKVASDISKTANDFSKTANDISTVTKHVDEIVVESRPKIGSMLDNFDETSDNFREFSEDVKYNPWKVLFKGKEVSKERRDGDRAARLMAKVKSLEAQAARVSPAAPASGAGPAAISPRQNFIPANKV